MRLGVSLCQSACARALLSPPSIPGADGACDVRSFNPETAATVEATEPRGCGWWAARCQSESSVTRKRKQAPVTAPEPRRPQILSGQGARNAHHPVLGVQGSPTTPDPVLGLRGAPKSIIASLVYRVPQHPPPVSSAPRFPPSPNAIHTLLASEPLYRPCSWHSGPPIILPSLLKYPYNCPFLGAEGPKCPTAPTRIHL
nr:charged multivesicular body protein 2a isoform X2 [Equus caballus]